MNRKPVLITAIITVCTCLYIAVFYNMGDTDEYVTGYIYTTTHNTPIYVTTSTTTTKIQNEVDEDDDSSDPVLDYDTSNPDPVMPGMIHVNIPDDLDTLIMLPFDEAFKLVVGTDSPDWSYDKLREWNSDTEAKLNQLYANAVTVTVPIWTWANDNDADMSKVSSTMTLRCNPAIEKLLQAIFQDIYNASDQPVFTPKTCGGYVVRGMASNGTRTSGHAFGCAIDLNYSATLNGFGNTLVSGSLTSPSQSEWASLPECHRKYEIFYDGCTVVNTFRAYGFQWGGDWNSYTDGMHFSFIGDNGNKARTIGQDNYRKYGGKK